LFTLEEGCLLESWMVNGDEKLVGPLHWKNDYSRVLRPIDVMSGWRLEVVFRCPAPEGVLFFLSVEEKPNDE
jgi:hypothetical protein